MAQSDGDRHLDLIDSIVQMTLKGKIRSKAQVLQLLQDGVDPSEAEAFEACLRDRLQQIQQQADQTADELQQAKATRSLRALQTIQGEWSRWQQEQQASNLLADALQKVLSAPAGDRLNVILQWLDPNRDPALSLAEWQQLAQKMQQFGQLAPGAAEGAAAYDQAILNGIAEWQRLEPELVGWIYNQSQGALGFAGVGQRGPWALWATRAQRPVVRSLLKWLSLERSPLTWLDDPDYAPAAVTASDLLELAIVLRCVQQGLVAWFEKRIYETRLGSTLAMSTFLTFAVLWSQLAIALASRGTAVSRLPDACFQITLQILRSFAQRSYFPLYGGVFASFSGQYLRDALAYLDEPLKRAEGTQEKARILTLLGYSARALGNLERAAHLHQQALEMAQAAGDRPCQIANLNHLGRLAVAQQHYAPAIDYSQRAVIVSREAGDRLGEANALATLGYSEVFQAQQLERMDPELYEAAIDRLLQGLQLAEKVGDRQSQAFCLSSAGLAYIALRQPETALRFLDQAVSTAQATGDTYLQAISLSYLAEAHHALGDDAAALLAGSLGMYFLEQMGSTLWHQPANLLRVMRGQQGATDFAQGLENQRSKLIAVIGVDGFDHLQTLLQD
jgi:tetratricopeptide (TPR) repeat protein